MINLTKKGFRDFLEILETNEELLRVKSEVDLRYVSAIINQTEKAVLFEQVTGYDISVVGGIIGSRRRLALAVGDEFQKITHQLRKALERPIPSVNVDESPIDEMLMINEEVDLTELPIPVFASRDGAPYITSGVIMARDPEHGLNAGMYRLMFREQNLVGIDIVTPNNLNIFYKRALERKVPLEVSISMGTHPIEMIAATYKASIGINEMDVAGGMHGEPVKLLPGKTVKVECLADAEIVLEGFLAPDGSTFPEGRFGEFSRLMGGIHINPNIRITAIRRRRDAIFYALSMPWENIWMGAPIFEAAAWRVLGEAGVEATAVHLTPGGCCHWHVIASIKKKPGDGKNALAALLSIADIKHAVVTDSDIDIFDTVELEWAIATRVQADKDVVILSRARAKPLDPSIPPVGHGITTAVTTAKMGLDATIPEDVPNNRYERITYPFFDKVRLEDFLKEIPARDIPRTSLEKLQEKILASLRPQPLYFAEMLEVLSEEGYREIVQAFGSLNNRGSLILDDTGRWKPTEA
ncbi:MAG: carboxylyase [Thaumarchaeota archaeon]|nr:carboxylyase [Nitrososphaerota archaeon]